MYTTTLSKTPNFFAKQLQMDYIYVHKWDFH